MKFRQWDEKKELDEAMGFVQKLDYQKKAVKKSDLAQNVNSPKDFDKAVKMFVKGAQKKVDDDISKNKYQWQEKLAISPGGKRYLRVYSYKIWDGKKDKLSQSAFCFIDKKEGDTFGDVLKPAGWKAPAKHRRSNIFDGSWGVSGVDVYGAKSLR